MKTKINGLLLVFFILGIGSTPSLVSGASFSVSIESSSPFMRYYQEEITATAQSTSLISELHIIYKSVEYGYSKIVASCYSCYSLTATFPLDIFDANPVLQAKGVKSTFGFVGGRMRLITETQTASITFPVDITSFWFHATISVFDLTSTVTSDEYLVMNSVPHEFNSTDRIFVKPYDISGGQNTPLPSFYVSSNPFTYSIWKFNVYSINLKFEVYYDDPYNFLDLRVPGENEVVYDMIGSVEITTYRLQNVESFVNLSPPDTWIWDLDTENNYRAFDISKMENKQLAPEIGASIYYESFLGTGIDVVLGISAQIRTVEDPHVNDGNFRVGMYISTYYSIILPSPADGSDDEDTFAFDELAVGAEISAYDGTINADKWRYKFEFDPNYEFSGASDPQMAVGIGSTPKEIERYEDKKNFYESVGTVSMFAGIAASIAFPPASPIIGLIGAVGTSAGLLGLLNKWMYAPESSDYIQTWNDDNPGFASAEWKRDKSIDGTNYYDINGNSIGPADHLTGQTYNYAEYTGSYDDPYQTISISGTATRSFTDGMSLIHWNFLFPTLHIAFNF